MDEFFRKTQCDRCGGSLSEGRIMSMYNTETICLKCKETEAKRPDYRKAADAELAAVRSGNRNFAGIGFNN